MPWPPGRLRMSPFSSPSSSAEAMSASKLHVRGDIRVPGDKSITHRALLLAACARGRSRIRRPLTGEDCRSTARVLAEMGVEVSSFDADETEVLVTSGGLDAWTAPAAELDCGNSGTTVRLLMGLLAGRDFPVTLTGDASLCSRPMRRITDPLREMGVTVRELENPDRLPVEIRGGRLHPLEYRSPKASAQIKSAVLLAGLSGGVAATVIEPGRSRDHTERMLRAAGVEVEEAPVSEGWRVSLTPPAEPLPPLDLVVPGDISSAAFLIALATLADAGELRLVGVGVNPTRTGLLAAMERMGARIERRDERDEGGEPVANLIVRPAELRAVEVGAAEVPAMIDELPILAALAARGRGLTRIRGAGELRVKETDRIAALATNLRALGVVSEEHEDGLDIQGSDAPLRGRVRTYGDHRIAMAFGVLAALPGNAIGLDAPDDVRVSYPGFWGDLARATGRGKRIPGGRIDV